MDMATTHQQVFLTTEQVDTFSRDGVLVVDDFLSQKEIYEANCALSSTLCKYGVETQDLKKTGHNLRCLSSTNGAGGVLDIFYEKWKLDIATNKRLLSWTQQLWSAAYCSHGEAKADLEGKDEWKWHPFGSFDSSKAFVYVDRIGYRLPTFIAEELGKDHNKGRKRKFPIQRSLTPHLDCCPDTFDDATKKSKWRPIQCLVSLSETLESDTGGFEAALGFHRGFRDWTMNRPPTTIQKGGVTIFRPPTCVGEYTHIRPIEDANVMQQIQHVSARSGSAVFWDSRIPHANAYRHTGTIPRAVVYCSFLPDVPINRKYAREQLEMWRLGRSPTDQWVNADQERDRKASSFEDILPTLSQLQRFLLGIDPWEERDDNVRRSA